MIRVGVVGFGSLGRYLVNAILNDPRVSRRFQLVFVWNRSQSAFDEPLPGDRKLDRSLVLEHLEDFGSRGANFIIEVAHPSITQQFGLRFLAQADYFVGSPTAFADAELERKFREAAESGPYGVYIPCGALWGAADIARMADRGSLRGLRITMKKHPASLKVVGRLVSVLEQAAPTGETVIFEGSVRELCPLAPNNVNTMAAAALAAHNLGFDGVRACLASDPALLTHQVVIEVTGPETPGYGSFTVHTVRENPAPPGAVTGHATYASFVSSLLAAGGRGPGFHFC